MFIEHMRRLFFFAHSSSLFQAPVLILSAEDDAIVPHSLAVSLHQETREAGKENIRFVILPRSLGLGHNDIYTWESLDTEITTFVTEVAKNIEQ